MEAPSITPAGNSKVNSSFMRISASHHLVSGVLKRIIACARKRRGFAKASLQIFAYVCSVAQQDHCGPRRPCCWPLDNVLPPQLVQVRAASMPTARSSVISGAPTLMGLHSDEFGSRGTRILQSSRSYLCLQNDRRGNQWRLRLAFPINPRSSLVDRILSARSGSRQL